MRSSPLLLVMLLPALAHAQAPPLTLESPNPERGGAFGYSSSGVTDADGDGRSDLLVGAPGDGIGGRGYLYSGATGALLRILISPLDPEPYGSFGYSVAGVDDADGDGHSDLLISALDENGGPEDAGRAYLYSGATGTLLHTLQSPNPEVEGFLGYSVSGVEDADGDGRGDLLVGAPYENGGAQDAGRAYLYSGAAGALLHTLASPSPEGLGTFGRSVSGVTDTDGDGRGDLLVGAEDENGGARSAGRAYLYSGASGALLRTLTSPDPRDYGNFGHDVTGVPDVDGDTRGDLLIGASGESRAYLFSGVTGNLLRTLISPGTYGRFGTSVSEVSDVDGDGRGDLLVGAPQEDGGAEDAGRAYVFSGATGALLRTLTSPNAQRGGYFGWSVSGASDADGDGRADFLISTPYENGGAEDAGRAYLFPSGGLTVAASGTPTSIPPGGAVTVTATVSNNTAEPATGDLWVVATRDGNAVLTRRIGGGTLPAGATATRAFALTAPGNTPPGVYTVYVRVGAFPDAVLASDAFDVTVTGAALASSVPAAEPFVVEAVTGDVFAGGGPAPAAAASSSSVVVSPNPFAGRTALRFSLAAPSPARLSVHDLLGREVAVLLDGEAAAGAHAAVFDARGLAAGVYVWRLAAGSTVQTGRLTLRE